MSLSSLNLIENNRVTIEVIGSIFYDTSGAVRRSICSVWLLRLDVLDRGLDLPPVR